ncbi:MAG: ATP-binding protein [Bacteroidota bacterium]
MLFSDVAGHDQLKERLIASVKEERISHAQMFLGKEGTGNLPLALAFAGYILCINRQDQDACGTCPSCRKVKNLIHPDLHFVFPVVKKDSGQKAISDNFLAEWREAILENPYLNQEIWFAKIGLENKQGSIYVDESSEILRKLSLKTFEGEYKVMIIWMPERMNVTTSNKLLKILEEPPGKTLFILVSSDSERILPTILSRVQLLKVPAVKNEDLISFIGKKFNISSDKSLDISRLARGNILRACQVAENGGDSVFHEDYVKLMRLSFGGNMVELIEWVEKLSVMGREKLKNFFEYCLAFTRENFVKNTGCSDIVFMTSQEDQFSKNFSAFIHENNVMKITALFNQAHAHVSANGYPKIILLDTALKIRRLLKQ